MSTLKSTSFRVDNIIATSTSPAASAAPSCIMELTAGRKDGSEGVSRIECRGEELEAILKEFGKIEEAIKKSAK